MFGAAVIGMASVAAAGGPPGALVYPEGVDLPRGMSDAEAAWVEANPIVAEPALRGAGTPQGPVHCVAEYEPMDGILMAYEGSSGWLLILRQMAAQITTVGNANVYVICDTSNEATSTYNSMVNAGAMPSRVITHVRSTNTIWMRDYGPRYIYEGGVRAVVDHTYNRPRPQDNALPDYWSGARGEPQYQIPLVHGGGNYHLEALGESAATRLIANENGGLSEAQIIQLWRDYQNLETTLHNPFPTNVDATQHIDMWMQMAADDVIVISDWPLQPGSTQDQICDAAAALYAGRGYTVVRVPGISSGGTHYTFTNVVMCNDLVLLPEYDNIPATYSTQALNAWQNAFPGKTVVQIDCDSIVTAAGVMHCIVMHVPANSGGVNPVVWQSSMNDGPTLEPGDPVFSTWMSDDDEKDIASIDILLSTNGGVSFDVVLREDVADTGSSGWIVPDVATTNGVVRVVATDGDGNTGHDDTDVAITINGTNPSCNLADVGEPYGQLDFTDVTAFLTAFGGMDALADVAVPFGQWDFSDITTFLTAFGAGCP